MSFSFFFKEAVLVVLTLLIQLMNGGFSISSAATDHIALLEIKSKITDDPQGVFKSWNDSLPFCHWQGVTCGRRHQRVTSLNLTGNALVGSLSPYLGNLSFLRNMSFGDNQLHGSIPPEIGRLFRLQLLSLTKNLFTGEIPSNLSNCSRLEFIDLGFNKLLGKIPNTFSSLLISLSLKANNFTGGIPPTIGNLTSLELLFLSYCPLGGTIPDSLNQLKALRRLSIGENDLNGVFPSFFFNLSMLEQITVTLNQLHGTLPSNLCLTQPRLQLLELNNNHFTGSLPPSISNCSELQVIDVGRNDFTGKIAIDFAQLQYLYWLFISYNNFESSGRDGIDFFDSLSNCSNLEALELINIRLSGVLPNSLGNFSSKLWHLNLFSNYISGHVPQSIENLLGLAFIDLGSNNFTGMIPESIGKLRNLDTLILDRNAFSGIIPRSIGNLSLVTQLELGGNKLEGTIPPSIGNCKRLIYLSIHANNLKGSVPKELFQLSSLSISLDLSENNLSGVLPQEIGNLKLLGYLDLTNNHLSGELPNSFSNCISLQTIDLSENLFHGPIPEALSLLRGLEYVNLSRNNFSGDIPIYLQQIPLKKIDLSYNNFVGEVPAKGVFANASAISIIGNNRLCGGIPQLNLTKCTSTNTTSDSKRSRKLSVRAVVAISLSCTIGGLAFMSFVLIYYCITKKRDKPSDTILNKSFEKISYGRLFKATQGFSSENLIGTGSFASVYKGVVDENGLTVAIKVLNLQQKGGLKSFIRECDALRNIRHRNLVKVITSCSSIDYQGNNFKALVYDFMPNGSMESWLHSIDHMLDLVQRINIIKDVACALEYLHCHCGNVVVHCDLKPSNVLLDADMVAHVGDFGLAKILSLEEVSTVDPMFEEGLSLHSYTRSALVDGFVLRIVDPVLLNENVNEQSLITLVKIGVQCSSESPQDRMDIETIVHELSSITVTTRS